MVQLNLMAVLGATRTNEQAQRALAALQALALGLDIERLLIYRRAVEARFYSDELPCQQ